MRRARACAPPRAPEINHANGRSDTSCRRAYVKEPIMRNTMRSASGRKFNSARRPSPSDRKAGKAKKIRAKWSARILRQGSLTGPAFIEFTFPTKGVAQASFGQITATCAAGI
jgi:hypothetical protein